MLKSPFKTLFYLIIALYFSAIYSISDYDWINIIKSSNKKKILQTINEEGGVNAKTNHQPVLTLASCYGDTEIVSFILDQGADINAEDDHGTTALLESARCGGMNKERIKNTILLLKHGATIKPDNISGWKNILTLFSGYAEKPKDYSPVLKNLLEKIGRLPKKKEILDSILIDAVGIGGWGPSPKAFEMLIDAGADINAVTEYDPKSVIHIAAHQGYPDIVRLLLKKGAKTDINDIEYVLIWATMKNHEDIVRTLVEKNVPVNPTHYYQRVWWGDISALSAAAISKNLDLVKYLMAHGAKINPKGNGFSYTPILVVAMDNGNKSMEIARYLVEHGADIDARDKNGWTPLYWAVIKNSVPMVSLLLNMGANPSIKDNNGRTALDEAKKSQRADIVKILTGAVKKMTVLDYYYLNGGSRDYLSGIENHAAYIIDLFNGYMKIVTYLFYVKQKNDGSWQSQSNIMEITFWKRKNKPDLVGIANNSQIVKASSEEDARHGLSGLSGKNVQITEKIGFPQFYELIDNNLKMLPDGFFPANTNDSCRLPRQGTAIICSSASGETKYNWNGSNFNP